MASEATKTLKSKVQLPCDLPQWKELKSALTKLAEVDTIEELKREIPYVYDLAHSDPGDTGGNYNAEQGSYPFGGLIHFLTNNATSKEKSTFFCRILPLVANLVCEIETLKPETGLQYSTQQEDSTVTLDRRFVASIVACAFLCLFPDRHNHNLNAINFEDFFQYLIMLPCQQSQGAKLRCILHYFERLADLNQDQGPSGKISFTRQVLAKEDALKLTLDNWSKSTTTLCPLIVRQDGRIEDTGSEALQVDFANRYIGGGVLTAGRVQEEIRFCLCPELLVSMLFMERMEDNEAIVIRGFEQYSEYLGYASKLGYAGDFRDNCKVDQFGNIDSSIVAIDASPCGNRQEQYRRHKLSRELKKAFAGFQQCRKKCEPVPTTSEAGDAPQTALDCYSMSLSKAITNVAVHNAKTQTQKEENGLKNAARKLADSVVPEIMTNALERIPTGTSLDDSRTGVRILPSLTEHVTNGEDVKKPINGTRMDLDTMATHWAHGILEDVVGSDKLMENSEKVDCTVCSSPRSASYKSAQQTDRIPTATSEDSLHKYEGSSSTQRSTESRSSRDSLEDFSVISSLSCKSDSFVKVEFESDVDSTSGSQSSKSNFSVDHLAEQILGDAYIKLYGSIPKQGKHPKGKRKKPHHRKDGPIQVNVPTIPNGDHPWTPPPSPTSPDTGSSPRLDDSSSRLEMCSERLRASISSADSSSISGADSAPLSVQDIQIRACAEQLVSRTLSESVRVLGGSLTTSSSSSTSSRRSSSRTSSIAYSSGSKRSSIDTFTEDLLKIANIDPLGKRPSRTEESLAFFAEEMQRRIEDDDRHQERRKSELADFEEELSKSNIASSDTDSQKYTRPVDLYADRQATVVVSDAFVQIYGRPWSRALSSDQGTSESEAMQSDIETDSVPNIQISYSNSNRALSSHMTEADLISMATNLSNVIIESAMRVYQEQLRQQQWERSRSPVQSHIEDRDRSTGQYSTLNQYAGGIASGVGKDSEDVVCDGDHLTQGATTDPGHPVKPIATGNWGCGAFGGDPQLKSLIQWLAASQSGCPAMYYYIFGDKKVMQLEEVAETVKIRNWTVGDLTQTILKYCEALTNDDPNVAESLFGHILHLL